MQSPTLAESCWATLPCCPTYRLSFLWPERKSCVPKVSVEGEYSLDLPSTHEHERDTVSETHLLVCELLEEIQRCQFVFARGSEDFQRAGGHDAPCPLNCKRIRSAASQERKGFVKNKVAGIAAPGQPTQCLPCCSCPSVLLVSTDMTGKKGASVNIDHWMLGSSS